MYNPPQFEEHSIDAMRALIAAYPLAAIVYRSPEGLVADHIPLIIRRDNSEYGSLVGHVAKNNPLWKQAVSQEVLMVFQGPDAYISPNWYPTKKETGKVVPTWNYAVVHVNGKLRAIEDPAWILQQLRELTSKQEQQQPHPWSVSDAPEEFIDKMINSIVGIEITITKMAGKWKVSQNQPVQNRQGVVDGLNSSGNETTKTIAALIQSRGEKIS